MRFITLWIMVAYESVRNDTREKTEKGTTITATIVMTVNVLEGVACGRNGMKGEKAR